MSNDHRRHSSNRGPIPSLSRRNLLGAAGWLAAAAAGAPSALAQSASAQPFRTAVSPVYFPRDGFVPELSIGGKVAVITGASRGIGLATGLRLMAEGVTVIGTSRVPANYPGHPFPLLTLDVSAPASVDAFVADLVAELGGRSVDILINNAGRYVFGTPVPIAPALVGAFEAGIQLGMETLYVGHVRVTNRLLPLMTQGAYSRLLFTVSDAGYDVGGTALGESVGQSFLSAYFSGKRALLAYANNLRGFLRTSGSPIQVGTVNPMVIKTALPIGSNPIYLEPVDGSGNSTNPFLQAVLQGFRAAHAVALSPDFVGETYAQLLRMQNPPPNVVTGSRTEPFATQCGSALLEQLFLDENAQSALPLGAAGAPVAGKV